MSAHKLFPSIFASVQFLYVIGMLFHKGILFISGFLKLFEFLIAYVFFFHENWSYANLDSCVLCIVLSRCKMLLYTFEFSEIEVTCCTVLGSCYRFVVHNSSLQTVEYSQGITRYHQLWLNTLETLNESLTSIYNTVCFELCNLRHGINSSIKGYYLRMPVHVCTTHRTRCVSLCVSL